MTNTPAIEIKNLTVVYNENTPNEIVALKDFSLEVQKGEIKHQQRRGQLHPFPQGMAGHGTVTDALYQVSEHFADIHIIVDEQHVSQGAPPCLPEKGSGGPFWRVAWGPPAF